MLFTNCKFMPLIPVERESRQKARVEGGKDRLDNRAEKYYSDAREVWQQYVQRPVWKDYLRCYQPGKVLPPTITLDDIQCKLKYSNSIDDYSIFNYNLRDNIHIGQRKLFLSELQALNAMMTNMNDPGLVIYAGSAPSMKLWYMMQLYPNVKYLMVDPNEFFIYDGRYQLPHYVRQDEHYVKSGDKWGVYTTEDERAANKDEYVYLSYSNSNMYESPFYKGKNILYYNSETNTVERRSKPASNSGFGKSEKHINEHVGEFNVVNRATMSSIEYVFASNHRVYFIEEYFTTDLAKLIGIAMKANPGVKVAFWSDIRTNLYSQTHPTDTDIVLNTAWTYSWLRTMQPDYSMLKWRLPFGDTGDVRWEDWTEDFERAKTLGLDFRVQYEQNKNIQFFKGIANLQTWEGNHSTESRLIVIKKDIVENNIIEWDLKDYEDRFFAYNMLERFGVLHENPNAREDIGFDYCNDCAIENQIWTDYQAKNPRFNVIDGINALNNVLKVPLLDRRGLFGHGHFMPDLTMKSLTDRIEACDYEGKQKTFKRR